MSGAGLIPRAAKTVPHPDCGARAYEMIGHDESGTFGPVYECEKCDQDVLRWRLSQRPTMPTDQIAQTGPDNVWANVAIDDLGDGAVMLYVPWKGTRGTGVVIGSGEVGLVYRLLQDFLERQS